MRECTSRRITNGRKSHGTKGIKDDGQEEAARSRGRWTIVSVFRGERKGGRDEGGPSGGRLLPGVEGVPRRDENYLPRQAGNCFQEKAILVLVIP